MVCTGQGSSRISRSVRLLVEPEAVLGLKQMGMHFDQFTGSQSSAPVTEDVNLVFQDQDYCVVRLESGGVISIRKDKIWGTLQTRPLPK